MEDFSASRQAAFPFGIVLDSLRVDGGMVGNQLLMQFQADRLNKHVVRPMVHETTALGAAYAAGLAVGFFKDTGELARNWTEDHRWIPTMEEDERERLLYFWNRGSAALLIGLNEQMRLQQRCLSFGMAAFQSRHHLEKWT